MIRSYHSGEIDYVIEAHTRIFGEEYKYDHSFEIFIRGTLNEFEKRCDPEHENLWILEVAGSPAGSIGIVKVDKDIAQLRWFLVEPSTRKGGYGKQLIQKAIDFSIEHGYSTIILWTNSSLEGARRLYDSYGFKLSETRTQILSGQELVEEKWELII
ncbi:MAG TPA: GNAT family N-acetyltransferase [Paenibacillus sp.]|jgi:GNAT superfamily N-acetyltransferase